MAGDTSRNNGKKGGRPKGSKSKATLEKEAALAEFRAKVVQSADLIFQSQMALVRGYSYLYKIEKRRVVKKLGKGQTEVTYVPQPPKLVTGQWEIESYLQGLVEEGDMHDYADPSATYYYIVTKDPSNAAAESLLNRTFGSSTQKMDITSEGEKLESITIKRHVSRNNRSTTKAD